MQVWNNMANVENISKYRHISNLYTNFIGSLTISNSFFVNHCINAMSKTSLSDFPVGITYYHVPVDIHSNIVVFFIYAFKSNAVGPWARFQKLLLNKFWLFSIFFVCVPFCSRARITSWFHCPRKRYRILFCISNVFKWNTISLGNLKGTSMRPQSSFRSIS